MQLARDPARFVVFVARAVQTNFGALVAFRKKILRVTTQVLFNDSIRGVENGLGRSEILFKQHRRRIRKALRELQNISYVGRAESVDRLIRVPDDADVAMFSGQHCDEFVLHAVRVLKLINQ